MRAGKFGFASDLPLTPQLFQGCKPETPEMSVQKTTALNQYRFGLVFLLPTR
jgi:hypothetical protein